MKRVELDLNKLEKEGDDRQLNDEEIKLGKQLQEELWVAALLNESITRQKAKTRWIKVGDCNSWYFHLIVNWKGRYNMLRGVFVGGCWLEEPSRVKEETRQFFKRRFEQVGWERPRLDGVKFKSISQQENDPLVARFEEEEVRATMWDCSSAKSLELDGPNFKFIKEFWDMLKIDLLAFWMNFMLMGYSQKEAMHHS